MEWIMMKSMFGVELLFGSISPPIAEAMGNFRVSLAGLFFDLNYFSGRVCSSRIVFCWYIWSINLNEEFVLFLK